MSSAPSVSTITVEGSKNSPVFKKAVRGGGRRGRCTFKKKDVTRLIEAACDAGVTAHRIEITVGDTKIALLAGHADDDGCAVDSAEAVLRLV
ncbi:hypothetical protein [Bradyrhizobium sp. LA7.1]|uniref:hypothetical protein n=1 Tax=Bradyrhizobium sp. LA7.1 TaxID=3156324 RepID=UPI00339AB393